MTTLDITLNKTTIFTPKIISYINNLVEYTPEIFDEKLNSFGSPIHDWSSKTSDFLLRFTQCIDTFI